MSSNNLPSRTDKNRQLNIPRSWMGPGWVSQDSPAIFPTKTSKKDTLEPVSGAHFAEGSKWQGAGHTPRLQLHKVRVVLVRWHLVQVGPSKRLFPESFTFSPEKGFEETAKIMLKKHTVFRQKQRVDWPF